MIQSTESKSPETPRKRRTRRRKTAHLKDVPSTKALRETLRSVLSQVANGLDRNVPPSKDELEAICRKVLIDQGQPEGFLGWAMVVLSSAFWSEQIKAIPPNRRLFLLPHCLKHAEGCPADYDEFGLACKTCGACSIADFRATAEEMGYKVLVAEGSPIVLKIIVSGHVDAIVGVACLNVLEKAIDKILLAGIPCMAVPLLSSDCRNTSVDEDWVDQMVRTPFEGSSQQTRSYLHLMRAANEMLELDTLEKLVPKIRTDQNQTNPIALTESIAYDFLSAGGKHSRPFMTMAVYDAVTDAAATLADGDKVVAGFPDHVKRTAITIETFHKASLVHDDIEDNDAYRYGQETLHRQHGVPTAINVGDYLVSLGYRIVAEDRQAMGAETAADILAYLADCHSRLCEGQGAELIWRDARDKNLKPIDALKVYALKTSPAFEAAIYCGLRLAGPCEDYLSALKSFSRNLGVAFQILNDIKDWERDSEKNDLVGMDLLGGRPTLLWALALESLKPADRAELQSLASSECELPATKRIQRARHLYFEANVFERAFRLVDKHQQKAEEVADSIEPDELRRLLYYLVDTVLDRTGEVTPTIEFTDLTYAEVLPVINVVR